LRLGFRGARSAEDTHQRTRFTEEFVPEIVRHRRRNDGNETRNVGRAPDFAEPIQGWRAWYVLGQEWKARLRSLYFPLLWEPGRRAEAECLHRRLLRPWRRGEHEAPQERCGCGIYATTTPSAAADYLRFGELAPGETIVYALGRVSLWGLVVECERGWRGSYAYPAALYVPTRLVADVPLLTPHEVADGLADYGVPVMVASASEPSELADAIEFGELVAEEQ
jgi:hypothetical protein